ncbi:MAG: tetratricopeptide repeat protein [Bacteroidia bacterium]
MEVILFYIMQKYRYFLTFAVILVLFFSLAYAEEKKPEIPDSLQRKVLLAKTDTARLHARSDVAIWMTSQRTDLMLDYLGKSMELAQKAKSELWIGKTYNHYGVYYGRLPDYEKALKAYFSAIAIFEKIENTMGIAATSHNLAIILEKTKDLKQALTYYYKAIQINQKLNNKSWLLRNYNAIASVYNQLGKPDSTLGYLQKSLDLATELKAKTGIMYANGNFGNYYVENKLFDKAEPYLKKAYAISVELNEKLARTEHCLALGTMYTELGQFDKAHTFLEESLNNYEQIKFKKFIEQTYLALSKLAEKEGNTQEALQYYKQYHEITDSLLTEAKNKSIREYEIKYQSEKKERENLSLHKDNKIKQLTIYGLGFIAALLVAFIAYFYYAHQQSKKQNALITLQRNELAASNQNLQQLLAEKDNIIATVSHDYRSPLGRIQAISELILLQKDNLTLKQQSHLQKIPSILAEATHLIDDLLAVTHLEKLSEQVQPEDVNIQPILIQIVENYQKWIGIKQLRISYDFPLEACSLYTDANAFRRIFDNLISNAIKYSPLEKRVIIKVERIEEHYKICVQDEGQGFSEEDKKRLFTRFQRLSAHPIMVGTSYGLGLSIVKTLVEGLHANIQLEDTEMGASFCVEIKDWVEEK